MSDGGERKKENGRWREIGFITLIAFNRFPIRRFGLVVVSIDRLVNRAIFRVLRFVRGHVSVHDAPFGTGWN